MRTYVESILASCLLVFLSVPSCEGFMHSPPATRRTSVSSLSAAPSDEAVAVFKGAFPKRTDPDEEIISTFEALSDVYGSDDALQMVKDMPICLTADQINFVPSLAVFTEIFEDETDCKEMIKRNPGLLFVSPKNAATSDGATMVFSYIVAATRPLGAVLLYGTILLLLEPLFELVTGIHLNPFFRH